jgi:LytS/YehU family sensor histidine kinase
MGRTLLTAPSSVLVCLALFLVGGWGLARDIWFERTLARAEAQVSGLAREAERAQLMALRAHLDPHFLFNTLNAIAEWCREDGETAERAVLQLSAMLRTVLAGVQAATWPLADELALMDTLFALHRLRDPDAFQLVRRVPAPLPDVPVPPMLLLPLAENAVKHGPTAGHRGPIELEVQVSVDDARLIFSLSNPGRYAGRREGGTGLETVERRLVLAYDGQAMVKIAGLDATPTEMERTVVEVTLPLAGPRT